MKEIRIHGRGGQGAVLAARMLASAFVAEGKYVASFPMYGFERRGAPVVAFTRIDDQPIREKTQIYNPNCVIVIDPGLLTLPTLFTGLKPESVFILNSGKKLEERPDDNVTVTGVVNATQIAVEEIVRLPVVNQNRSIKVPSAWLSEENGRLGLFVVEDEKALFREVTLGSYYRHRVEILT